MLNIMKLKTIAITLILSCIHAFAEPATKPTLPEPPPESQTKEQALAAFRKADKELNEVWAEVKKASGPMVFKSLQEDQQGWIEHRDHIATGLGNLPSGTDPAKAKDTKEYLGLAAELMTERAEYLRAKIKDPGPAGSLDGVWRDSVGGLLLLAEQDSKVYFACTVVRGPTFHLGELAGIAKWNKPLAFYTDGGPSKDDPDKRETWIFISHAGSTLTLEGANTQYYHGARAFFDGTYTRTRALSADDKKKLIEAATKGEFPK